MQKLIFSIKKIRIQVQIFRNLYRKINNKVILYNI